MVQFGGRDSSSLINSDHIDLFVYLYRTIYCLLLYFYKIFVIICFVCVCVCVREVLLIFSLHFLFLVS